MLRLILVLGWRLNAAEFMFTNINGLHGNRDPLAIAATKFDVLSCAETKVTDFAWFQSSNSAVERCSLKWAWYGVVCSLWSFCFAQES